MNRIPSMGAGIAPNTLKRKREMRDKRGAPVMRLLALCPDDKAFPSHLHGQLWWWRVVEFERYFMDNILLAQLPRGPVQSLELSNVVRRL